SYVYVGYYSAAPVVTVSSDNGVNFTGVVAVGSDNADVINSLAVFNLNNLYAGMASGSVCKSTDNGMTWPNANCIPTGLLSVQSLAVDTSLSSSTGFVYA